jgi:hypothetical protein
MLIYTHCWELMNSMGSHGSSSLPFVVKVMVCHFVSDSHEVMTALIVVLPLIVVVEISLQLHRSFSFSLLTVGLRSCILRVSFSLWLFHVLLIYASQEPEHKTSILHNWHFAPKACSMLNKSTCFVLFTDCFHFCNY